MFEDIDRTGCPGGQRSSASLAKTMAARSIVRLYRTDARDELRAKTDRQTACDTSGRVGKVPVIHDQERWPRQSECYKLGYSLTL